MVNLKKLELKLYYDSFIRTLNNKKGFGKVFEILIRVISLLLFPIVYLILFLIKPFKEIRLGFLYNRRIGHLALNTDLFIRSKKIGSVSSDPWYLFFAYEPANKQLLRMIKRELNVIESEWLTKLFVPIGLFRTRFWQPLPFLSNEYKEFNYPEKSFSFTIQERKLGRKELEKMGIGEDSWYVCIFARDEIYSNTVSGDTDNSCTDHRNGDIDTYISAAKYIVDRGGYVIRMGHLVSKDFGYKHEKVVDYATCCRTDFMDVYLAAHCKFFLGTASGGADLAHIFNTPFVGVNWVELGTSPIKKNEIFIPKHIRYINNHEDVPFNIQIDKFRYMPTVFGVAPEGVMSREGMEFSANTSEEILEITKEMFARVEQKWSYDKEYSDKFESYLRILDNHNHWFYKAATKSTIGDSFLKNMKLY